MMDSTSFSSSTVTKTWDLRQRTKQPNYKVPKESDINAAEGSSKKTTTKFKARELYPIQILEEDSTTGRFKVHYMWATVVFGTNKDIFSINFFSSLQ